jgi:cyclophilin family peptidyl-prolyl cis-trans isomerase
MAQLVKPQSSARKEALQRRRRARVTGVSGSLLLVVLLGVLLPYGPDTRDGGATAAAGRPAPTPCETEAPGEASPGSYDAPDDIFEEGVDYGAVIHTSCGDIGLDLLEDDAPEAVNSFVFLAREGFYDGLTFHRVVANFVIQAGDPNGRVNVPPDDAGYKVSDRPAERARDYVYGVAGLANQRGDPSTGGSQFFIVVHKPAGKPAGLQTLYTIFGKVEEDSYGTLDKISRRETKGGNDPATADEPTIPIYIESIEITEAAAPE